MADDPQDTRSISKIGSVRAPTGGQRAISDHGIVTERGGGAGPESHDIRRRTPGGGVVADFAIEEVTGNYQGLELEDKRNVRHPTERMSRLEKKADKFEAKIDTLDERMGRVEVAVADVGGQMKVLPDLVDAMKDATATAKEATKAIQQQHHMTFTAKVEVDKAKELGKVEVETAQSVGEVEVKKSKWQISQKLVSIVLAIATAISTTIAARGC